MQVWIGTSGYSYADWVGPFYPDRTRPDRMLSLYSRSFPLVELNFTFYRLPTGPQLTQLASKTPPGFQFLVKLPRSLSHETDDRELPAFRAAVDELRQRDRLSGLLCQLPQASHYSQGTLNWLNHLGREFAGFSLAVEFRHRSWLRADVPGWLAARHMDLVAVDVPTLPGLYPRGLVQSGRTIYVRFHSGNADNWYLSDKERYDYHYDDAELTEWVTALQGTALHTDRALLLFNNCHGSQAPINARRMRELLERSAPRLQIVAPFASDPPPVLQRSLFD